MFKDSLHLVMLTPSRSTAKQSSQLSFVGYGPCHVFQFCIRPLRIYEEAILPGATCSFTLLQITCVQVHVPDVQDPSGLGYASLADNHGEGPKDQVARARRQVLGHCDL